MPIPRIKAPQAWASLAAGLFALVLLIVDIGVLVRLDDPADYAASLLELRAGRTEELASALEAVSYQFLSNQLLNDTMASYAADSELYDVSRWNSLFSNHLEGIAKTVPELEDAVFFDFDDTGRIPLTMSDSLTRRIWKPVREIVFDSAVSAEGRPVWDILPPPAGEWNREEVRDSTHILCARLIKRNSDGLRLGVLVLLVDPDRFARTVSGFSQDEGIAVSKKTDYSLLLDGTGRILASVDPALALMSAREAVPGFEKRMEGRLPMPEPGRYMSSSFWVVYNPVQNRDWTLLSILPIGRKPFGPGLRLILVVALAFCFLVVYRFARSSSEKKTPAAKELVLPTWWDALSPKEASVLLFLLTGKGNKEIASLMGLREQTVKNYLHAAYGRIGAQDRVSAIVILRDAGFDLDSLRRYAHDHPDFPVDPRIFG
ncbi:MAG TPA: helix-turn-helix transcriptional regulator [Rectinemataceae bacterium]